MAKKTTPRKATPEKKGTLPQGASWLTPYLTVARAEQALDFYERAFGFSRGHAMPGRDGTIQHAEMTYQERSIVMFSPEGAWGSSMRTPAHAGVELPVTLYVYCEDVDRLAERARSAGATVTKEPETMFWGDRIVDLRDPDGYRWTFATKVGEFDPSRMPPV